MTPSLSWKKTKGICYFPYIICVQLPTFNVVTNDLTLLISVTNTVIGIAEDRCRRFKQQLPPDDSDEPQLSDSITMAVFKKIPQKLQSDDSNEPQLIDLTFAWRIENFCLIPKKVPQQSTTFMVAQVPYVLELIKDEHVTVKLHQVKPCEPPAKLLCTVRLVDRYGKLHCIVKKEVEIGKGAEEKELLKIPHAALERKNFAIFSTDILSMRLSVTLLSEDDLFSPHVSKRSLEALSRDLKKLHDDETDSDVVLRAGDTEYKAHRLVLAARSPTFARMFRHNTREGKIHIVDLEASVLAALLDYIYAGKVQGLTPDTVAKLMDAAVRYQLQDLQKTCTSFLAANLAVENICSAILAAEKFRNEELKNAVCAFMSKNAPEIINSDQWGDFKANYPAIANVALSGALLLGKEVGESNLKK